MAAGDTYFLGSTKGQAYVSDVFAWLADPQRLAVMQNAASIIGISVSSIAGAMGEEYDAYVRQPIGNALGDTYAKYFGYRFHESWKRVYDANKDELGVPHRAAGKFLQPIFSDIGPANIQIGTAIGLVEKYALEFPELDLAQYTDANKGYLKLIEDLSEDNHFLSAIITGLMVKEATDWFRNNNAQGPGGMTWDEMPQEYRDALLVTYFNLGEKQMEAARVALGPPYAPLPALDEGGGMSHLLNAYAIGSAIGSTTYGRNIGAEIRSSAELVAAAVRDNENGALAARYALLKGRYVAIDSDYSSANANGELELYDAESGTGELTKTWLDTRATVLDAYVAYLREGENGVLDTPLFGQWGDVLITDPNLRTATHTLRIDGADLGVLRRVPGDGS
jgi:hypothetical protein